MFFSKSTGKFVGVKLENRKEEKSLDLLPERDMVQDQQMPDISHSSVLSSGNSERRSDKSSK